MRAEPVDEFHSREKGRKRERRSSSLFSINHFLPILFSSSLMTCSSLSLSLYSRQFSKCRTTLENKNITFILSLCPKKCIFPCGFSRIEWRESMKSLESNITSREGLVFIFVSFHSIISLSLSLSVPLQMSFHSSIQCSDREEREREREWREFADEYHSRKWCKSGHNLPLSVSLPRGTLGHLKHFDTDFYQ